MTDVLRNCEGQSLSKKPKKCLRDTSRLARCAEPTSFLGSRRILHVSLVRTGL